MAILAIELPPATARLFSEVDVPGTPSAPGSMHITLLYLGDDVPIDALAEAAKATYEVTSKTRPFTVRASRAVSFPVNPDQDEEHPEGARTESDELHDLWKRLGKALDGAGVDFSKKFPVYKPHVTLSYAPEAVEEFTIPTIEWGAHEVVLWGGDEADERLSVTFPFSLRPSSKAAVAHRVAARFMSAAAVRGL